MQRRRQLVITFINRNIFLRRCDHSSVLFQRQHSLKCALLIGSHTGCSGKDSARSCKLGLESAAIHAQLVRILNPHIAEDTDVDQSGHPVPAVVVTGFKNRNLRRIAHLTVHLGRLEEDNLQYIFCLRLDLLCDINCIRQHHSLKGIDLLAVQDDNAAEVKSLQMEQNSVGCSLCCKFLDINPLAVLNPLDFAEVVAVIPVLNLICSEQIGLHRPGDRCGNGGNDRHREVAQLHGFFIMPLMASPAGNCPVSTV